MTQTSEIPGSTKPKIEIGGSSEPYLKAQRFGPLIDTNTDTINDWPRRYADCPHLHTPGGPRFRVSELLAWMSKRGGAI